MNTPAKSLLTAFALWGVHLSSQAAPQSLQQFVAGHPTVEHSQRVIACAAGGKEVSMDDETFPISVYFYPVPGATDFRYFESSSVNINSKDYSKYRPVPLDCSPPLSKAPDYFQRVFATCAFHRGWTVRKSAQFWCPDKCPTRPAQSAWAICPVHAHGSANPAYLRFPGCCHSHKQVLPFFILAR